MAKLRLLGGFDLQDPGQESISIATLKGRALLAYLACAKGRIASRDSLALLLWSDSDSRKSKQNLRQVLFKLSHTLDQRNLPILLVEAQTIALRTDELWVDTWELESLAEADTLSVLGQVGSLYQGEFLQGLALDAPVFEDWLQSKREEFENRALNAMHLLLERQREAGDLSDAISTGLRALEIDSTQEQSHRALMELYFAKGMRGAALNQYRICKSILHRDLDAVPERITEALYQRIHDSDPEPDLGRSQSTEAKPSWPLGDPPVRDTWVPPELPGGRAAESQALQDAFAETCKHGARLFALSGEAGIGKTYLLNAFARHLETQGIFVCRVATRQAESRVSLGLWRQIMDILWPSRRLPFQHEASGLHEISAPYRLPRDDDSGTAYLPRKAQVPENGLFSDVLNGLARSGAQGPLVVILEDIQWADADSLQGLGRAVQSLRQAPVLFVTTARLWPELEPASIAAVFGDLEKAGLIQHCNLEPLSFGASMALLDGAQAEPGQTERGDRQRKQLWKFAEGNPEILLAGMGPSARNAAPALPRNLQRSARQIIDRVSSSARTLVQFASLVQGPIGLSVLVRAARLDQRHAAKAADKLTLEKLLSNADGKVAIARAWFGKAVFDDLPMHRHRAMHAAIAAAIREVEAGDLTSHYAALAYHFQAAGENVAAAGYRLSALEVRVARGSVRGASQALGKIARCLPARPSDPKTSTVLWRAGFLRAAIAEADSDTASALRHLRALERRGPRNDDPRANVALSYALSRACCVAGEDDEGLRYARRTLRLSAEIGGAEGPWKLSERLLFRCYLHAPAAADVISGLQVKAQQARLNDAWSSVGEIVTAQAMMEGLAGRFAAMKDSFESARSAVARQPDPWAEAALLQVNGMAQNWTGGGLQAIEMLSKALALTSAGGDLIRSCTTLGLRGQAYFANGLLEEAKTDLEMAIEKATTLGSVPYLPLYYCWLADVNGRSGHRDEALKLAHHAWRLSYSRGQVWTRATILRTLARRLADTRRPNIAAAERAAREAVAIHRSMGIGVALANSQVAYAEVQRAAGDTAGSRVQLRQALDLRRRIGVKATVIEGRA